MDRLIFQSARHLDDRKRQGISIILTGSRVDHCGNNLYTALTEIQAFQTLMVHHSTLHKPRKAIIMKKLLLVCALLATGSLCMAQQVGHVISSTPILQQVAIPHQVCTTGQMAVQQPKSGAGALMGAIAGGFIGNAVGQGAGRGLATMAGVIGGAALGDSVEGSPGAQYQNVQRCTTQNSYENRPVAYNVVYEFGGKQYSVQMPNDPGPTLQLQVTPVGASAPAAPPSTVVTYAQPLYQQPTYIVQEPTVYYPYPAYRYYSDANYVFPAVALVGAGFWLSSRGGHGHGHRHWRR